MKTLKTIKTMKYLSYLIFVLVLGFSISSCSGDDGATGPAGTDGVDGEDGNANVTVIDLLATDFNWTADNFLTRPANVYTLTDTAVNQDIMDHGTVLAYCHFFVSGTFDEWMHLPFVYEEGSVTLYINHTYKLNTINLYAYTSLVEWDPDPTIPEYRFMLITDNTVTGKSAATASVLKELENAGIDVYDYYQVCDYYGINPD